MVPWGILILVVGSLVLEDNVQRHVEVPVVHVPLMFSDYHPSGEPHRAGMVCKILLAANNQLFLGLLRLVLQGEEAKDRALRWSNHSDSRIGNIPRGPYNGRQWTIQGRAW